MPATLAPPTDIPQVDTRPRGDDPFPSDEFETIPNRPVFAEHETTTSTGRQLKFGYNELKAVADRCNRRIVESGDYAVLCLGHTPGRQAAEMGAPQPKVVGFAGPFRMGAFTRPDGTRRYTILADEHIYREDWPEVKKNYPRRSAELWAEDDYADMFLDPIALLGAETPRLDLGMVYGRLASGKVVEKYAAVFPGATSVHALSDRSKLQEDYEGSASMAEARDPQLVQDIVEALMALPQWQYLESMMESQGATPEPGPEQPAEEGAPMEQQPVSPEPAAQEVPPEGGEQAPQPVAPTTQETPPEGEEKPPREDMAMPSEETDLSPGKAGQMLQDNEVQGQPLTDKQRGFMGSVAGQEKKQMKAMYAAVDAMDPQEFEDLHQYMSGKKHDYQAEGNVDGDDEPDAEAGTYNQSPAEGEGISGEAEENLSSGGGSKPTQSNYARASQEDSLKYQLETLKGRVSHLEGERDTERKLRIDAQRKGRLVNLHHQGFVIDPDKAMERLCYAKCPEDEQFDSMLSLLLEGSPRAPVGAELPYVEGAEKYERHRPGIVADQTAEKYSREEQQTAWQSFQAWQRANPNADTTGRWELELENARKGRNGAAA